MGFIVPIKYAVWSAQLHGGAKPEMGDNFVLRPILVACLVLHPLQISAAPYDPTNYPMLVDLTA